MCLKVTLALVLQNKYYDDKSHRRPLKKENNRLLSSFNTFTRKKNQNCTEVELCSKMINNILISVSLNQNAFQFLPVTTVFHMVCLTNSTCVRGLGVKQNKTK